MHQDQHNAFFGLHPKVSKLLDFTDRRGADIADPWYTGNFDVTYTDVKEGCEALLEDCLLRL